MAYCSACQATIVWHPTPSGRRMPLDVPPSPDGSVVVVAGKAIVLRKDDPRWVDESVDRYVPHWASCPYREQFRQPKQKKVPSG